MSSYVKNIKLEAFSHQFFVMPTTAQEVYNQVVCHLSSGERLRLATIILNQLVGQQQQPSIDQSDTWTEEDQIDLVNFSLNYAAKTFSDVEGG
ncbi:MAG: hypothetical protein EWV75_16415 [Microcystis wesenbergii Mw_QC_S_20081001_S30D]|uniref:Uncharacterized protein n=1 Tax=Microcystis wesenbergii Mw_QC_S_20081001_S30D TaxID=2486245 RepID=A0A552JEW7_9CHRO|nr:hypothetical protein [Microcystis aeruginosa W11-03]NCR94284.1 hypothetical protein [Microcystis aeruginosa W11-06]TRU94237.1 MAG: hypothetical protein EWV75_16415 [Microcystis wesenbergii Mw_QC_S_20081001_S30D]TRU94751.1 MAG: hypothetical protein EWV73_21810 [Microcystis wesenbergii Mw_QC_B_20070930_S4D]TRV03479.1 MAG: hypothetical protein EWV74_07030 [Microcystis wesenbergii Mw_QC_S_20081001_S30]TRV16323.1 MAG: hypothetical protein EWV89_05545 [Microcystis wesenbergii Mw_QC_B_20070930_S4]